MARLAGLGVLGAAGLGLGLAVAAPSGRLDVLTLFVDHLAAVLLLAAGGSALARSWTACALTLGAAAAAASIGYVETAASERALASNCAAPLTVALANLNFANPTPKSAEAALLATGADIVVTLETTDPFRRAATRLAAAYPHRTPPPAGAWFYAMIWSRAPLAAAEASAMTPTRPHLARAVIAGARPVDIIALHLSWPVVSHQSAQVAAVEDWLAPSAGARIILGDFNASPWSGAVRRIARAGGVRRAPGPITWRGPYPGGLPAPIGLRLDHVLASQDLALDGAPARPLPGSDHRMRVAAACHRRAGAGAEG